MKIGCTYKIPTMLAFKSLTCFPCFCCFIVSTKREHKLFQIHFLHHEWCIKKERPPPRFPTFHPPWFSICSCSWHLFRHHFYIKKKHIPVFSAIFSCPGTKSPGKIHSTNEAGIHFYLGGSKVRSTIPRGSKMVGEINIWMFPKIGGTPKWMVYTGKPY